VRLLQEPLRGYKLKTVLLLLA